ncbi:MAG: inositol monophosphatase family protein [bacterium]
MNTFEQTASAIAREAGEILRDRPAALEVSYKGAIDLLTEMDRRSEEHIFTRLKSSFPDHEIFCEEGSRAVGSSGYRWIVDPLDGTTNYAHKFPVYAVSIALEERGEIILGVVYNPVTDELFSAEKGKGAFLNGNKISVSTVSQLNRSLLATGFPYSIRENPGRIFERFKAFSLAAQAIRRPGVASLDLCYLAAGWIDGFWEENLQPWDVAAGSLIVKEAGGTLSLFDGSPFHIDVKEILASNRKIHYEMLKVLREV